MRSGAAGVRSGRRGGLLGEVPRRAARKGELRWRRPQAGRRPAASGDGKELDVLSLPDRAYRGFELDEFQCRALEAIENERSVLVSAPTGTGKTLIADYLIERAVAAGRRVIYTAPIKALSNQKFSDYCDLFGEETVGILTGDVAIRPEAPVVIMTTEILRNQLITADERLEGLSWVVFDEIHYIASDRGIAWEESLILLPRDVRILGLSATIGNLDALAAWIEETLGSPVVRVRETRRAVPLVVRYVTPDGVRTFAKAERGRASGDYEGRTLRHFDLVDELRKDCLPALYFVFSRIGAEERAREAAERYNLLGRDEQRAVQRRLAELKARYAGARDLRRLEPCLAHGVAYHHAGLLPATKRIVEQLYAGGLIKLLYCTETFAVGVNYPVRGVAIETTRKFDGRGFRPLTSMEFQQMTGRAGRRGMDERGFALIGVDGRDRQTLVNYGSLPTEPVESQFFVTESSVLNLLRTFGKERAVEVLARNFHEFQRRQDERRLRDRSATIEAERLKIWDAACPLIGTPRCPLERERLERQLAEERRKKRRRRNKRQRDATVRNIRDLSALLAQGDACPRPDPQPCRPFEEPFAKLSARLSEAQARLDHVSSFEMYRTQMDRVCALLERLGYVRGDSLLGRGEVARHLHVEPILLTELIFEGLFHAWDPDEVNAVLAAVDYDPRHDDACYGVRKPACTRDVERVVRRLRREDVTVAFEPVVSPAVYLWSRGAAWTDLLPHTTIQEGDLIGAIRRAVDLLRQLRQAVRGDAALQEKFGECQRRIDRDEASIVF